MSKYFDHVRERTADWILEFAKEQNKQSTEVQQRDKTTAVNYLRNMLDVSSTNKFNSIESKIEDMRNRVGLNMLDSLEKSAEPMQDKLSIRDKMAAVEEEADTSGLDAVKLEAIKLYVSETIKNRNGHINTPAMVDLVSKMFNLDHEWLMQNIETLKEFIASAKQEFAPSTYKDHISPASLAKNDIDLSQDINGGASPFVNK